MKVLDRYLLREMLVPLLVGTFALVLMFQANVLIGLYKEYQLANVPPGSIFQFVIYKTPQFVQLTLPIGMALASSLAVSRLVRESELTAIRGAGAPILRVMVPVAVIGLLFSGINFAVTERLMPQSEKQAKRILNSIGVLAVLSPQFRSDAVLKIKSYAVWIRLANTDVPNEISLEDVLLVERRGQDDVTIVTSKHGRYKNGIWNFLEPHMTVMRGTTVVSVGTQKPLIIQEPISVPDFFMTAQAEEQTAEELKTVIDAGKRTGKDTRWPEVNYHSKFSIPFACLVFSVCGPAMSVWLAKRGALTGVLMSLMLAWLYFNLYIISTQILGRNGWVQPWLAAWLPNVILLVIGVLIIRRLE